MMNRLFFITLTILIFSFSVAKAEYRFDEYRYSKYVGDTVSQVPLSIERTVFSVFYYDTPDFEQYLYEKYGMVKVFEAKELVIYDGHESIVLCAPAGTKSSVSLLSAAFSVEPECYEEIWDALREDTLIYSVQPVIKSDSSSCIRMNKCLSVKAPEERDVERVMNIADSLNLVYVRRSYSGIYEFEATSQSMYVALTCANIIYEETGLYAEPIYSATIPYSGEGVLLADGVKYKAFSDSTYMVFGESLIRKGRTILCPASTCMVLSGYYNGSVDIPEKIVYNSSEYAVTTIEEKAFALSKDLTSVSLPSSLTSMGFGAFFGCSALKSLLLPSALTSVGAWAFSCCESLESIVMPDDLSMIPEAAFWGCVSLKNVTLPSGLKRIGAAAFTECKSLSSINLPVGLKTIEQSAFQECTGLTSVVVPDGVDSLGNGAFYGCTALQKVTLPESLAVIDRYAFQGDVSLIDVVNLSSKPQKIDDSQFPSRFHATLHVPEGCAEAYRSAEIWRDFANIVEDAATSVNQVAADDGLSGDIPWFDLSGRRVDSPAPGIYIRGGRKVLLGE